jgi:hypothetical protein
MTTNTSLQPQFYDHQTALAPAQSAVGNDKYVQRTKNRALNGLSPEQYFLEWHRRLQFEGDRMRTLWNDCVTVHRRFRGKTLSDDYGYFGTRPDTQGHWIDPDPDIDGEVHPINIVRPDIRANVSALLQVNVSIDCEPVNEEAKNKQRAERIQFLIDFFTRDCWSEEERGMLFDAVQKEGVNLVESYIDRECGSEQQIAVSNQVARPTAKFECADCKASATLDIEEHQVEHYHEIEAECPKCGGAGRSTVENGMGYDAGTTSYKQPEIKHRTWSAFEFLIDRKGSKRKGIRGAKFLQIMELVDRADLESQYPQFQFEAPYEWSYSLKCQHALAAADWSVLYSQWNPVGQSQEWDLFEKKRILIHESAYRNYVSPEEWEFVDGQGVVKFSIKRGETMEEAQKRMFGPDARGVRPVFVNERLIDFEIPPDFELDFREQFAEEHFQRDSGSFYSLPHWDTVRMQDTITLFNTIKTNTAARNSINPVWFDSEIFDISDFGNEFIPSKNGALDDAVDIRNKVIQMPTAKTADAINEHLLWLMGIRREVSGVQPAMLGEAQPGAPYAAQRQQLEQSMGLLTPASKSFAQMMVASMKQKLKLAFKYWTLEQFQSVASRNGETWTEGDVAELTSTDLERDVLIDYVPGTEVPQGTLTKELKFWNGVQQALPLIQAAMTAGTLDMEVFNQLLKRIDEFADFDFDLSGLETADALAQKRYEALSAVCEPYRGFTLMDIQMMKQQVIEQEPIVDPATGQPAVDPASGEPAMNTLTGFDVFTQELMTEAEIFISPVEDPAPQLSYLIPEIMRELAKPKPHYLLVELLQMLAMQFGQMQAEANAQAIANDPETQKAEAGAKDKDADRRSKAELEDKKQNHELTKMDKQHKNALELATVNEASKENDRDFGREEAAREPVKAPAKGK